ALRKSVQRVPPSSKKVTIEFLLKRFVNDAERPWMERHLAWFGTGLSAEVGGGRWAVGGGRWAVGGREIDESAHRPPSTAHPLAGAMLLDYTSYLRDNLLVKVDRGTMLSSV